MVILDFVNMMHFLHDHRCMIVLQQPGRGKREREGEREGGREGEREGREGGERGRGEREGRERHTHTKGTDE
jgi:hypothetical protein